MNFSILKKWHVTLSPSEVHSLPQLWSSEDLSISHQLTVLRLLVTCTPCLPSQPSHMELLKSLKIDVDGPSSETLGNLTALSLDTSLSLREEPFKQALTLNLACDNDSLVSSLDTRESLSQAR